MKLCNVFNAQISAGIGGVSTAQMVRAMGGKAPIPERADFRTSDGKYIRTADGKMFNVKEE